MHDQNGSIQRSERPLDKTWRWIRPESVPEPAAQSGTVLTLRVMVIGGESEPARAPRRTTEPLAATLLHPSMPAGDHDCVPVAPSIASEEVDWRTLSFRDFTEVAHDRADFRALAFARTQPAIDIASLGLPAPLTVESTQRVPRRRRQPSPAIAFGAAAAACVLSVLAATFLVP